jgi:hypothetical protein
VPDEPRPFPPEDEYPRRRRRRRPPPPSGRGPVFWILLTFGLIGLGSCACCGGVFLILPGAQWRTHNSIQGGFAVELPATPQRDMKIPGVQPDPAMKVEGTILWSRGESFVIFYRDMLARDQRVETDDELLDAAVKEMQSERDFRRMIRNDRILISGFPARDLEFLATDGGTYGARLIVADSRYYALVGGGRFSRAGNANVRRFLTSFKVTDPKLLQPPRDGR